MSNNIENESSKLKWRNHYDKFYQWVQPILAYFFMICAALFAEKFLPWRESYPSLKGVFDSLEIFIDLGFLFGGLILVIINLVHKHWVTPSMAKLISDLSVEKEKTHLISENIREVFDGCLLRFSQKLDFGKNKKNDERISLFIHDGDKHFIACARYSANPSYCVPGRTQYPDDQGCIALGWKNGWHFDKFRKSAYLVRNQRDYNMDKDTIDKIKMKSVLYGAQRIDGREETPLAVLVVESMNSGRYTEDQLKDALTQGEELSHLADLIEKFRHHIPNVRVAAKRGF